MKLRILTTLCQLALGIKHHSRIFSSSPTSWLSLCINDLIPRSGIITQPGIYGKSYFYAANGYYYLTNTCNRWTAQMLAAAGLPMAPLTLTAGGVIRQVRAAQQQLSPSL